MVDLDNRVADCNNLHAKDHCSKHEYLSALHLLWVMWQGFIGKQRWRVKLTYEGYATEILDQSGSEVCLGRWEKFMDSLQLCSILSCYVYIDVPSGHCRALLSH